MSQIDLSLQLEIVKHNLSTVGYQEPNGAIIPDYKFVSVDGKLGSADLLAFGDAQRHDISTACIAVKGWPNGHDKFLALKELSYVGSPIALLVTPNHVEVWPVRTKPGSTPQQLKVLPYEELPGYFNEHAYELSPRSLLSAKRGERQLSFLDIDPSLIFFARDATQKTLIHQFESAIGSIPLEIREKYPKESSRIGIWVLAARILQDKLVDHNRLRTSNALKLLEMVRQLLPNYFTTVLQDVSIIGEGTVQNLYDELSGDFTFRSLTNDMLADFYEGTLVDEETRKSLGIYYTPRSLAQRILHRLPLEDLRPEDRTIFDGTCGSGSLLLAAYDRLAELLPARWSSNQRHNYLLDHLWGLDKDNFACEVARLSLLLYNLPIGNGWKITSGDVFQVTPQQIFGSQPGVIVGNPPFEEQRSSSTDKKRTQIAAQIVDRYLTWLKPDGLLGIILPLTFLHNASARNTRETLLKTCDILEVWHLPEGAIPGSSVVTAVILARKLPYVRENIPRLATRVNREVKNKRDADSLPGQSGYTLNSYLVSQEQWFSDPQQRFVSSPLDHIWSRLDKEFIPICPNFCTMNNGVLVGKIARPTHFSEHYVGEGWKPVLKDNLRGKTLQPYAIDWYGQKEKYIKYPSKEIEGPRTPADFERPIKLIMNATRNPRSPWRFYVAIDSRQLVVTENFHYILPKKATVEELAAVLNSPIANAWFSSRNYHRDITLDGGLKQLPFPNFSEQQKQEIRELVHQIGKLNQSEFREDDSVRSSIIKLDEIVFDAYGLDNDERNQIREWMGLFHRPGREWEGRTSTLRKVEAYRGRHWTLTGEIESIDIDRKTVSLWLEGQNNSFEMPIPSTLPGWALRPGVSFQAITPWEQRYSSDLSQIDWLDFHPLGYDYLSDTELLSQLSRNGSD